MFSGNDLAAGEPLAIDYRPARPEEVHTALRLILGSDQEAQLADFLAFADERQLDLNSLWIAHHQGRLLWSILPVLSPGRTMLLFSPGNLHHPEQARAAGSLAGLLCDQYRRQDIHLAQVLLDLPDQLTRQAYEAAGFSLLAQLDYLQTTLWRRVDPPALPNDLTWLHYSAATHPRFAQAILASYRDSRDCPALNGRRGIDDILTGHKATGQFDPDLWFLLCRDDQTLGVLLLSTSQRSDAIELVYLGLCPEARGQGLADLLMRQSLWSVRASGKRRLALAVDAANPPALKLYYRHGLHRIASKLALMRDLRGQRNTGSI